MQGSEVVQYSRFTTCLGYLHQKVVGLIQIFEDKNKLGRFAKRYLIVV